MDCRGHVGSAGGTGVVVAVVDGGEMHFRNVGGCENGGVGECGEYGRLSDFADDRLSTAGVLVDVLRV